MLPVPSNTEHLSDLQRAVDSANDAVRSYAASVEVERRRGSRSGAGQPKGWTVRQAATLARLQGSYLAALEALRTAARDLKPAGL